MYNKRGGLVGGVRMREVEKEAYLVKCRIINDFFFLNSKFHLVLLLDAKLPTSRITNLVSNDAKDCLNLSTTIVT